jgi:hypothetical protein
MELTALEKDLVVAILNRADGEDMEEIVERSTFQGYLIRSLMLGASNTDIQNVLDERNELIKRRITLVLDDVEELRRLLPNMPYFEDSVQRVLSNIEIALDLNDNESDSWTYYKQGRFAHLNK